jgi:hypothetical protein
MSFDGTFYYWSVYSYYSYTALFSFTSMVPALRGRDVYRSS